MTGYALGCPMWAEKSWVGELFAKGTKPSAFLAEYASVFDTVEGNTTFYALPSPETVARWHDEAPEGFRFCLKFHRGITHDKRLIDAKAETEYFFRLFAPLGPRLGPFLLQLPPTFSARELPALEAFLDELPKEYSYAVEVRHNDFFTYTHAEDHLNTMLSARQVDRVILDARGVHRAQEQDEDTLRTQTRKPLLPVHYDTTGRFPMVRFISHPTLEENLDAWEHWAHIVSNWRNEGQYPYFFMHVPNNFYAPRFARRFHSILQQLDPSVADMPTWPIDRTPELEQFNLF